MDQHMTVVWYAVPVGQPGTWDGRALIGWRMDAGNNVFSRRQVSASPAQLCGCLRYLLRELAEAQARAWAGAAEGLVER